MLQSRSNFHNPIYLFHKRLWFLAERQYYENMKIENKRVENVRI